MISKEERPDFHLPVRTGWMNDPNGFSYLQHWRCYSILSESTQSDNSSGDPFR